VSVSSFGRSGVVAHVSQPTGATRLRQPITISNSLADISAEYWLYIYKASVREFTFALCLLYIQSLCVRKSSRHQCRLSPFCYLCDRVRYTYFIQTFSWHFLSQSFYIHIYYFLLSDVCWIILITEEFSCLRTAYWSGENQVGLHIFCTPGLYNSTQQQQHQQQRIDSSSCVHFFFSSVFCQKDSSVVHIQFIQNRESKSYVTTWRSAVSLSRVSEWVEFNAPLDTI